MSCDRKFWELEETPCEQACQSAEERMVVRHSESNHTRSKEGRFIVPLPKDPNARPIGESRSQAVRRFLSLEHSLNRKGCFQEFGAIMQEYLDLGHAEVVPTQDMEKLPEVTFYLPIHTVYKTSIAPLPRSERSLTPLPNPLQEYLSTTPSLSAQCCILH